ncbi:TolC family protein [Pseudoalteromonas denitrificans]|uniref:Efflux transporter, outer membrane factor (OMF) lipoprotein, NodT family n=1 Tax=Pseudoalteromonas denitrificans DSM 6059 TaxID=1123010 RepID=A0A1I1PX69_9GAMM|nr:TolC family protein [Pseudoalteromonas denitrificans]SFD11583.1 efflux transporter, outer membrane factor (OMF) lipoprotein, NodT family [Pseudoalteromonas denitrificans DSM 6059]
MRRCLKPLSMLLTGILLSACSTVTEEFDISVRHFNTPEKWQNNELLTEVKSGWLLQLENEQIQSLVLMALDNNFLLKQQAYSLQMQRQELIISNSTLWPSLDLVLSNSRRKNTSPNSYTSSASVDLNLKYELDLWGKLSDSDRQVNLDFMAKQAEFEQAKQQLVADVVIAWFKVIESKQLVTLYQQRADNSKQNLDIIESGYQQGLNSALDVYLSRTEVNNELSRTSEQQAKKVEAVRVLELLLGQYPEGQLNVDADLPLLNSDIPMGLPSELIKRKPQLIASWYQLLAKDAGLAFAHKQRFPSISLTASIKNSDSELSEVLSVSSIAWSLLGNLAMPLFNAGKLEANEEKSRLALKQNEQAYLQTLHDAFSDVENALTQETSLKQRYQMMVAAKENAIAAQRLSFENYQNGLVNYTTVLDAQSRSFDAQSTVIQIKNQLIKNRIQLHIALGGDFSATAHSKVMK